MVYLRIEREVHTMSAFTVHPEHIRTLVWAGLQYTRPGSPMTWPVTDFDNATSPETVQSSFGRHYRQLTRDTAEVVGQILLDENVRSVNYRYSEDERFVYDHATPASTRWTPVEILSAIDCYEYQACETPEWSTSEAHAICVALRHILVRTLPGYENGPWEITPDSQPHAVKQALAARAS